MNILHVTRYCHVVPSGGVERYILDLIKELGAMNHKSAVGWLTLKTDYKNSDDPITVFPLPGTEMAIDRSNPALLPAVGEVADHFRPDVIHFHTFGRSEAAIARWAKANGIPYTFTYHSPSWTCRRVDLMAFDKMQLCDGEVKTLRCSACKLQQRLRKSPDWLAWLFAIASTPMSLLLAPFSQSRLRRRTAFIADNWLFRRDLRRFLRNCDLVYACAEWSVDVLINNGALETSIKVCPQGVSEEFLTVRQFNHTVRSNEVFNIGYVGRVVPVKGIAMLVEAFSRLTSKNVRLSICGGPGLKESNDEFYNSILLASEQDPRIKVIPFLPMTEMARHYQELDLLCIPSLWPETGPLVLFEALQFGIPTFGTSRVGQLKLLESQGVVVEPNTSEWYKVLRNACQEYFSGNWGEVRARAFGSGNLRSMADVARDVNEGYSGILRFGRQEHPIDDPPRLQLQTLPMADNSA